MLSARELLKRVILKTAPPGLQRRLRRRYVARQILKGQGSSEPEAAVLRSLIEPGDFVADAGANVGIYTKQLSTLVGATGHVYTFEPISENYEILEDVLRLASLSNVTTFHAAVGSHPGRCEMVIPDRGDFSGFYWAPVARPGDAGERETVEVLTLDELWKKKAIRPFNFIKCDVEGSELGVLRGSFELTRSHHPGWLVEVSRRTSGDVFELFQSLGYRSFVYANRLEETLTYRDGEFSNYFFLHPESKLWRVMYRPAANQDNPEVRA